MRIFKRISQFFFPNSILFGNAPVVISRRPLKKTPPKEPVKAATSSPPGYGDMQSGYDEIPHGYNS